MRHWPAFLLGAWQGVPCVSHGGIHVGVRVRRRRTVTCTVTAEATYDDWTYDNSDLDG